MNAQEPTKKELPKLGVTWISTSLLVVRSGVSKAGFRLMAPPTRMKATKAKAKPPKEVQPWHSERKWPRRRMWNSFLVFQNRAQQGAQSARALS